MAKTGKFFHSRTLQIDCSQRKLLYLHSTPVLFQPQIPCWHCNSCGKQEFSNTWKAADYSYLKALICNDNRVQSSESQVNLCTYGVIVLPKVVDLYWLIFWLDMKYIEIKDDHCMYKGFKTVPAGETTGSTVPLHCWCRESLDFLQIDKDFSQLLEQVSYMAKHASSHLTYSQTQIIHIWHTARPSCNLWCGRGCL